MNLLQLKRKIKSIRWKYAGIAAGTAIVTGAGGAFFMHTQSLWYRMLIKPAIHPPDWVFLMIWAMLQALFCIFMYYLMIQKKEKATSWLCMGYILFSLFWTFLFGTLQVPHWALLALIPLIIITVLLAGRARRIRPWLGWLMLVLIVGLIFTLALNYCIVMLN